MAKNEERRWRSKVSEGLRVRMPKDIADIYEVKKDDMVEWIYDGRENIRIEIKEMVLRGKKAKVEKVGIRDEIKAKVEKVGDRDEKKVKVKKVEDKEVKVFGDG